MASDRKTCSIDGCKRAITCLCRHCNQDVCSKHFNEHQTEVNNQLIPIADHLNELRMKLQIDPNSTDGPLAMLDKWRNDRYEDINREYDRRVRILNEQISKQNDEITQTISNIRELLDEGDVSIDQVKQMERKIEQLTNQVNKLLIQDQSDLIGKYLDIGGIRFFVKGRIQCQNTDLYALESEKALIGYNGLCPKCESIHVIFEANRGMYASVKMEFVLKKAPIYLTPNQCAREFLDNLLEEKDLSISMSEKVSPLHLTSLIHIGEMFCQYERSLFLSIVAEIGQLCSEKTFEHIHYLISFLDHLMDLHSNEKYRDLIEKYLNEIVYADLTDHFIDYPIVLQIQIMDIVENHSILHFPLIREDSEADQSKIELFLQDAARYFYNISSRTLYRQLVFRLDWSMISQQSILRALLIGSIFLPVTCHGAFLDELYYLLSKESWLLSSENMEIFFHVLWPTGINQSYSVARVYLAQLLIVRLMHVEKFFGQIVQICFLTYLRVPHIRVNLMDVVEPLCETEGFQKYLDEQEQELNISRQDDPANPSVFEPFLHRIHERMRQGFRLKQLCRMKIRSILRQNRNEDLLKQINQLNELSERNRIYLTYNLQGLLADPERYVDSNRAHNEPIWNSSIPPPPSTN